jgi:hypothetical protein
VNSAANNEYANMIRSKRSEHVDRIIDECVRIVETISIATRELLRRNCSGYGLKSEITAVGILCADHATPSNRKRGILSVGIVRSLTKAMEFSFLVFL